MESLSQYGVEQASGEFFISLKTMTGSKKLSGMQTMAAA